MSKFLIGLLAAVAIFAQPAHAGRIWQWAESAQFDDLSTGCEKRSSGVNVVGNGLAQTVVECQTPGANARFLLPMSFPDDAPNTWSYRMHSGLIGNDAVTVSTCDWTVAWVAVPAGSDVSNITWTGLGGIAVTTANTIDAVSDIQVQLTDYAGTDGVIDLSTGVDCTGTACRNYDVIAVVTNNANAGNVYACEFIMLEVQY